jgi:hypothetical protein
MLPFDNYSPYPPAPKPVRTAPPVASRPAPAPVAPKPPAFTRVEIPPPDAIGITIQEPPVVVPSPGDLGIRLDRP